LKNRCLHLNLMTLRLRERGGRSFLMIKRSLLKSF